MSKYIFVLGGVVSGLGKGITAASLGQILKLRGLNVFVQKFDPYINVDPGMMSPLQHGEVFVTKDGGETDLDLGHYERFIDTELTKNSSITTGKIYLSVINRERNGEYFGATVQVIPHITNEIKRKIIEAGNESKADIVITEIGGTVGDIESLPFIEAIRQLRSDLGKENVLFIHTTLIPYLEASGELKTKPTQHSVKELRSLGIQPDVIVCRSEYELNESIKNKIALFCDVKEKHVIVARDVTNLYEIPILLKNQGFDDIVCEQLKFNCPSAKMKEWEEFVEKTNNLNHEVKVALVGKYTDLHDAYLSVVEALKHAGYPFQAKVKIKWIDTENFKREKVEDLLNDVSGLIVPDGFGERGSEAMIEAIRYAREKHLPFMGIGNGMHLAAIEYARNVVKINDPIFSEWNRKSENILVDTMKEIKESHGLKNTMRLGNYDIKIKKDTLAYDCYQKEEIVERHRNRYEIDNKYLDKLQSNGFIASGINEKMGFVEIMEIKDHPFFLATIAHIEFISRPKRPHPLLKAFIKHAIDYKK